QTVEEAKYEAEYFMSVIWPYRDKLSLWAAVDVESEMYLKGLPKSTLTKVVNVFMEVIAANGYRPMLYTNPNYIKYRFESGAFDNVDIWLAHYGVKQPMSVPRLQMWQYGVGRVDGIKADVDVDVGYFDGAYEVGGMYTIKADDRYTNGVAVPQRLVGKVYTILQVKDDRVLLGEISSWVKI
ncbi:MAG: hypothetical protein HFE63_06955, partial [Clostridiales bacterium]|nr:hypothetical protein [Clostridiales bacterium]